MAAEFTFTYRELAETLDAIFWEAEPETLRFISVSANAGPLLGYPQSAWTSNPAFWADILHPDDRQQARSARMAAVERCEDHRSEYRVMTVDGRTRWIRDAVKVTRKGRQPARLCGLMVDVTESREQQQREAYYRALVESQGGFASTFDEAPIGIAHTSLEGRWLRVNRRLCELLGYSAEELMASSFMAITHPDDVDQDTRALRQLLLGSIRKYEREKRYRHKDGHFVSAKLTAVLHCDGEGIPLHLISTIEDVTDRVRLEAQLRQRQKMEAVGRLAGGISHDFSNLLTVIVGYAELVLLKLAPGTPMHRDIQEIRHAGRSAAALTSQLLAFSRKQILQPVVLDLNTVVSRMNAMLRRLIGDNIQLTTRLATPLDRVWADPGQIEQIIVNLAINARDAMPDGGRLTIETRIAELDADWVAQHPGGSEGRHVLVAVSDTGIGMDESVQAHIFEPFFTTKERGSGTGLGLATVYGIVKQSGGAIFVYSEPGQGTTFKIFLPVTQRASVPLDVPRPVQPPLGGTETILLVEDQPQVLGLTRSALTRHGYQVLEAASGSDALSVVEKFDGTVHLLLTDMVMAGMSGRELADQLIARLPGLRVLYMSGYTDEVIVRLWSPGMAFIQKPFTVHALLQQIRELLDSR